MLERGWTRRALKAGDQVTAYVFVAKNGAPVGNLQKIVMADGKELSAGGGGARAAPPPPPAAPRGDDSAWTRTLQRACGFRAQAV